jgi:hypothetical protein
MHVRVNHPEILRHCVVGGICYRRFISVHDLDPSLTN